MPHTSCKAHMEFIDTSAVADGTAATGDNAAIGSLPLLSQETTYPAYAVPDLNTFLLDGSRTVLEPDDRLPFVSGAASGSDCAFTVPPVLTVTFTVKHTSAGITLCFESDYPAELKVAWYDLSGAKIIEKTFYPDKLRYFCKNQAENYGKVVITFLRTRLPGQRVQLGYIKYGTEIEWTGSEIQSASITEEVDATSSTVPINTAEVSIVDEANDFELSNQNGVWKSIQKRQQITITEETPDREVTCGTLYIDTWKSDSNIVSFSLIDLIGLMDKTKFYGGEIYSNEPAAIIIAAIMESAGVENYTVSDDVAVLSLSGHIPICTHREALQQVVFVCGAVADCSRQGGISIRMPDRYADSTIGTDRKFLGTTIEMDKYVSGVAITYKNYTLQAEAEEISNDTLPAGESMIEFSEPYQPSSITVTAGTITEAATNYVRITMAEAGECAISGKRYESRDIAHTAKVDIIEAGEEENILSFDGCTLFNAERVKDVAERLLNYYQLRQIVNLRYLIGAEKIGDWVNIRDTKGNTATTGITKQTIDLTGGFIASATCRGYSKVTTVHAYAGEIYAGERGII